MPIFTGTRQSLTATHAQVPPLPDPNWFFGLPSAADGGHILLVDKTDLQLMRPQISLAVADPDGGRLRALGTFSGTLQSDQFSPDGRWLLVMLNYNVPERPSEHNNPQQQRVLLFDLSNTQAPHTLEQIQRNGVNDQDTNYLYALFLRQPPYEGRILILRYGTSPRIRLLAPDGSAPDQTYDFPLPFYINVDPAIDRASGQLLVSGTSEPSSLYGDRNQIAILTPLGTVRLRPAPVPQDQNLQGLGVRAGYALYLTGENLNNQVGAAQAITITSLPITESSKTPRQPITVYSGTITLNANEFFASWHAGAAWLAYATPNGELHARRYDGSGDVLLERGVNGFTALYPYWSGAEP